MNDQHNQSNDPQRQSDRPETGSQDSLGVLFLLLTGWGTIAIVEWNVSGPIASKPVVTILAGVVSMIIVFIGMLVVDHYV